MNAKQKRNFFDFVGSVRFHQPGIRVTCAHGYAPGFTIGVSVLFA